MRKRLTAKFVESRKPPTEGRLEISDTDAVGLRFRLTANGAASWSFRASIDGQKICRTLGSFPEVSLSKARERARALRSDLLNGALAAAPGEEPAAPEPSRHDGALPGLTVAEALTRYDQLHLATLKCRLERRRQLDRVFTGLMEKRLAAVTVADVRSTIDCLKEAGHGHAANRHRAAIKHFLTFWYERDAIGDDFGRRLGKATKERPRDRILTLAEIHDIIRAATELGLLWANFMELLVLTAQRRGEVAAMQWTHIDWAQKRWSIPLSGTKKERRHIVPLSDPALLVLHRQRDMGIHGRYVFTTTGQTAISGFSKFKSRLDLAVNRRRRASGVGPIEPWVFHDLRTAFATAMNEDGADEAVVDRILNHAASGSKPSAVSRVYNQSQLLDARTKALGRWAEMVTGPNLEALGGGSALPDEEDWETDQRFYHLI